MMSAVSAGSVPTWTKRAARPMILNYYLILDHDCTASRFLNFTTTTTYLSVQTVPQLPIEVWELVLDPLAPECHMNYPFLTCCLTCRSWLPRSRVHLYRDISVEDILTRLVPWVGGTRRCGALNSPDWVHLVPAVFRYSRQPS